MGKLLITEEDRRHILKLYNIVNEAIDPKTGGKIVISNKFDAGYHKLTSVDNVTGKVIYAQIAEQLKPVVDFIKNNPDSIVKIKFISGESNVPNRDNETKPATRVNVGYLSNKRKESMQAYINTFFNDLKEKGIIKSTVEVPPIEYEYIPPKTPWVGSFFCKEGEDERNTCYPRYSEGIKNKDEKFLELKKQYDSEQRSDLEIEVVRKEPTTTETTTIKQDLNCAVGLSIRIYVESHECQNAEFFVMANNTLLKNTKGGMTVNLNNANVSRGIPSSRSPKISKKYLNPGFGNLPNGDGTFKYGGGIINLGDIGGPRSDTFIVDEPLSKQIVAAGNGFINIWMIATTTSAHRDIPNVEIKKNGKLVRAFKPKIRQGKLMTLNACGTEVLEITNSQTEVPDMTEYIMKLQKERISAQNKNKDTNLSDEENDGKTLVLERSADLLESMIELVKTIQKDKTWEELDKTKKQSDGAWPPNVADKRAKLKEYYDFFQTKINQEPSFAINMLEGLKYEFTDKTIRKNNMYGDVRLDLQQFYQAYIILYYDNIKKTFKPEGVNLITFAVKRLPPEWKY